MTRGRRGLLGRMNVDASCQRPRKGLGFRERAVLRTAGLKGAKMQNVSYVRLRAWALFCSTLLAATAGIGIAQPLSVSTGSTINSDPRLIDVGPNHRSWKVTS